MTSTEQTTSPRTTTVEFDIVETTIYRGRVEIDPADFLEATGTALTQATAEQIKDYVADADLTHEESSGEVQGSTWARPSVAAAPPVWVAFEADGLRGDKMVTDVRVHVDAARYTAATTLDLEESSYAQVRAYMENHPEECRFDGPAFVPVAIHRYF